METRRNTPPNSRYQLIGKDPRFLDIMADARIYAKEDRPILILGETGTGKEGLSHLIHEESGVSGKFVSVNLNTLSESLVERELFGHVSGAFTDAQKGDIGYIEAANNGTLFLDEIDKAPQPILVKLLRVIEYKEFCSVGSTQTKKANFRLIVATNQDLRELVKHREFPDDFYYRIAGLNIQIPPLRERPDDIPELASTFYGKQPSSQDVWQPLQNNPWPGNVRDLKNCVELIRIKFPGGKLSVSDVENSLRDYIRNVQVDCTPERENYHPSLPMGASNREDDRREKATSDAIAKMLINKGKDFQSSFLKGARFDRNDPFVPILAEAMALACIHIGKKTDRLPRKVAVDDFDRTYFSGSKGKGKNSLSTLDSYLNKMLPKK